MPPGRKLACHAALALLTWLYVYSIGRSGLFDLDWPIVDRRWVLPFVGSYATVESIIWRRGPDSAAGIRYQLTWLAASAACVWLAYLIS